MRISFERTGGFANVPLRAEIDTTQMPAKRSGDGAFVRSSAFMRNRLHESIPPQGATPNNPKRRRRFAQPAHSTFMHLLIRDRSGWRLCTGVPISSNLTF